MKSPRERIECLIVNGIITQPGGYANVRDFITPSMFWNPACKAVVEQYEGAWQLYMKGESPSISPTEPDITAYMAANGMAKEFASIMTEFVFMPYSDGLYCMHLIEHNLRDFSIGLVSKITIDGHKLHKQIDKLSDLNLDIFETIKEVRNDLILIDQSKPAATLQKLLDSVEEKVKMIRSGRSVAEMVAALERQLTLRPSHLEPHIDRLESILNQLQSISQKVAA